MREVPFDTLQAPPHMWLFRPHVWRLSKRRGFLAGYTNTLTGRTYVLRRLYLDPYVAAQYAVAYSLRHT